MRLEKVYLQLKRLLSLHTIFLRQAGMASEDRGEKTLGDLDTAAKIPPVAHRNTDNVCSSKHAKARKSQN